MGLKYKLINLILCISMLFSNIIFISANTESSESTEKSLELSSNLYSRNFDLLDTTINRENLSTSNITASLEPSRHQLMVNEKFELDVNLEIPTSIDDYNEDFNNSSGGLNKDVIVLLDKSSEINGNPSSNLYNGLEGVLNKFKSEDNLRIAFMTYNSQPNSHPINGQNFFPLHNGNQGTLQSYIGTLRAIGTAKGRNINTALESAINLFKNNSTGKKKTIIIVATGDYDTSVSETNIKTIKNKSIEVITVKVNNRDSSLHLKNTVEELHYSLYSSPNNLVIDPSTDSNNNSLNDTIGKAFELLKSVDNTPPQSIIVEDVSVNIDIGDEFSSEQIDSQGKTKISFGDLTYQRQQETKKYKLLGESQLSNQVSVTTNKVGENLTFKSCYLTYTDVYEKTINQEISCPKITVVENTEEPDETIRILEIQPSNKFSLTKDTEGAATGTENFIEKVNGVLWNVQVDHITMSEFIGKIDQLNGKYDVVVIGKEHGDYTEPFNEKPEYIHNGETGTNKINNDQNSESQVEYYSENDITDKRAKEILSLINSGQLVFVNESIFELKNTKLYENFSSLSFSNFIKYNKLDISQVIQEYALLSEKFKQPVLNILKSPLGDINNNQGDINSRKLGFEFEVYGLPNEQIEVSLYLDINGDGLFRESDEELRTPNGFSVITLDKEGYAHLSESEFYYTMPSDFIGHLSWKLVIQRTNDNYSSDILNYQIGDVKLNRLPQQEKILIKVLQVVPGCGKQNNVYTCGLNANSDFNQLIQNLDYDIQLDVVNVDNFNKLKLDNNQNLSLESYDMIIIGFANSYNEKSISTEAIEALKRFIETGQSVMFTHDTMSYAYKDEAVGRLTREFRSVLGQARFEPIKYTATSPVQLKDPIIYDTLSKSDSIYSLGRWTMGYTKAHLKRFAGEKNTGVPYAGEVYQINEGQITNYPFEISEQDLNQNDDKITISVAKTHYQNFQLNLEQENLVPWYSLSGKYNASASHASYDPYDVRNNYYTYSIGNLTYSGTGHDSNLGGYKEAEIKLFINTIVKAIRGANKAPTFDVFNLTNGMEFFDQQPALNFSITPYDLDKDKMNITVTVENSSGQTKELKYKDKKDNENFEVSIPKEYYDNSTQIKIVISVEDEHGAQATPRTFSVNITNEEKLNVEFIPSKSGYLVGDTVEMQTIFTKEDLNNGYKFSQFNVTVDETDVDGILKDRQSEEIGSNVVVDKDNNQLINKYYYTVGESVLIPSDSSYSKAINIEAQYRYTKSHSNDSITEGEVIKEKITGSLNVREGVVTVKFIDENDKPISNLAPQISLVSDKKQYEGQVDLKTGSVTFRNIPTGTYTLVIEQIPGYNFGTYYEIINNEKIQLSSTLSISYENNNRTVYVSLADPSIKHGLYQGFSEGTVLIDEKERILQATSIIQFASSFSLKNKSDSNITLSIDGNIELLKDDKIKVYQVIDHKMKEIHEVELSSHSTTFNLSEKLQEAEVYEIVILYKGKLKQPEKQYTNKIKVNKVSKEAKIRSTGTTDLPDLF